MKRFTDTNKWRDPWFRRLSPAAKLLWLYLTDYCDCTGLIDFDIEAASFHIGAKITEKHLSELGNRVQRTVDGKVFIPRFIPFQQGTLSERCPAHKPILKLIKERNLSMNGKGYQYPNATLAVELPNSTSNSNSNSTGTGTEGECEGESPKLTTPEQIYEAYPRHEKKPEAIRAILAAVGKGAMPDFLLERTLAYAKTRPPKSRFTPLPASWFNAERYNDDPTEWQRDEPVAVKPKLEPWQIKKQIESIVAARNQIYNNWKGREVAMSEEDRRAMNELQKKRQVLEDELIK